MPKITTQKIAESENRKVLKANELSDIQSEISPEEPATADASDSDSDIIDPNNPPPPRRVRSLFFGTEKSSLLRKLLPMYQAELARGGKDIEVVKQRIYVQYRRNYPEDEGRSLRFNHAQSPWHYGPRLETVALRRRVDEWLLTYKDEKITPRERNASSFYARLAAGWQAEREAAEAADDAEAAEVTEVIVIDD